MSDKERKTDRRTDELTTDRWTDRMSMSRDKYNLPSSSGFTLE